MSIIPEIVCKVLKSENCLSKGACDKAENSKFKCENLWGYAFSFF